MCVRMRVIFEVKKWDMKKKQVIDGRKGILNRKKWMKEVSEMREWIRET